MEVQIWAPEEKATSEFHCAFQIKGTGRDRPGYSVGADGVQAVILTLQRIGTYLYCSEAGKSGSLCWLGNADLGFPVPPGFENLIPKRS